MIFVGFAWQLQPKFASSGKALSNASVIDVHYLSDFKVNLIENVVLYCWAIAASKTGKKYAFLAVRSLHFINHLFSLS